jgi:hypothetical protein
MHNNRMPIYLVAAVAVAVVLRVGGVPYTSLLPFALLLACPLMMIFMMKGMGVVGGGKKDDTEDHTGHGCEHDPTRTVEHPARRS